MRVESSPASPTANRDYIARMAHGQPDSILRRQSFPAQLHDKDLRSRMRPRTRSDGDLGRDDSDIFEMIEDVQQVPLAPCLLFSGAAAAEALAPPIVLRCYRCFGVLHPKEACCNTCLCNRCYDECPKHCRMCNGSIPRKQLRYGSGLCSSCYHFCRKDCLKCGATLALHDLNWKINLCAKCLETTDTACRKCSVPFPPERLWWGSHLCSRCWDSDDNTCKACLKALDPDEKHWNSNLCNACFDSCPKICKVCSQPVKTSELLWRSELCNACHDVLHVCKQCKKPLRNHRQQVLWNTGLCDECYEGKRCSSCNKKLYATSLYWDTGLCDVCYDTRQEKKPHSIGVWVVISAQFVFYMAQEVLKPLLFLEIQRAGYYSDAPRAYACVMWVSSSACSGAQIFAGFLADRCGARVVYCLLCFGGALASAAFAYGPSMALFVGSWTLLTLPAPSVRGVRAAFFAKNVDQKRLVEVGNLASNAGIVGGFSGPLLAVALSLTSIPFKLASLVCAVVFFTTGVLIAIFMPGEKRREGSAPGMRRTSTKRSRLGSAVHERCSQCGAMSGGFERALCPDCSSDFENRGLSFWLYSVQVMVLCWAFVLTLEISLNAGVIVAFQPVVVEQFGWPSRYIALVNTAGAALGFLVLSLLIRWNPDEAAQATYAAACYLGAVVLFMAPPLAQWRLVAAVMVGAAAQLMLYPALEALYAHKLGKVRVTICRAVVLSLASSVGTALGTMLAPLCVAAAGSSLALLAAVPALGATVGVSLLRVFRRPKGEAPATGNSKKEAGLRLPLLPE